MIDLAIEIFNLVNVFRAGDCGQELPEEYMQKVREDVAIFVKDLQKTSCTVSQIEHIKYAVVAFVDELILYSNTAWRNKWQGQTLQQLYFAEHLAGESFFERLNKLRCDPLANHTVLEVYYICLQLGFMGRYRHSSGSELQVLCDDLRRQLMMSHGEVSSDWQQYSLPQNKLILEASRRFPAWVVASVALAVMLFSYFGFIAAINYQAKKSVQNLQAVARRITNEAVME